MLLEVKLPRVETPCVSEGSEPPGREDRFQEFACREGKELSDTGRDRNTGLTNAEELVDKSSVKQSISKCAPRVPSVWWSPKNAVIVDVPGCSEDRSDEPSTEGTRRHCGIIVVVNRSANLGVWGVLKRWQ